MLTHRGDGEDAILGTWTEDNAVYANWTITNEDLNNAKNHRDNFYFKIVGEDLESKEEQDLALTITKIFNCDLVFMCSEYSQDDCAKDLCDVAYTDVEGKTNVTCGNDYNCYCYWNSNIGSCDSKWNSSSGECTYSSNIDDTCDDGFLHYSFTATWVPVAGAAKPAECTNGETVVPCPSQIQLTGFDIVNIILIVALLVLIYWAIALRRKNNKKGKDKTEPKQKKKVEKKKPKTKKSISKKKSKK